MTDDGRSIIDADRLRAGVLQTTASLEANPTGGRIRPYVDARLVKDVSVALRWEQFGRTFELHSDEPGGRGGQGTAPTAIRYFLSGIASCLQVWFAKGAALTGCEVHGLTLRLEASLDMRVEYGLEPSGSAEYLLSHAVVESPSPDELVLAMAHEAHGRCPLWNLVIRGVPGYRRLERDGRLLLDTMPPGEGGASAS
jgi:hypothetical protein